MITAKEQQQFRQDLLIIAGLEKETSETLLHSNGIRFVMRKTNTLAKNDPMQLNGSAGTMSSAYQPLTPNAKKEEQNFRQSANDAGEALSQKAQQSDGKRKELLTVYARRMGQMGQEGKKGLSPFVSESRDLLSYMEIKSNQVNDILTNGIPLKNNKVLHPFDLMIHADRIEQMMEKYQEAKKNGTLSRKEEIGIRRSIGESVKSIREEMQLWRELKPEDLSEEAKGYFGKKFQAMLQKGNLVTPLQALSAHTLSYDKALKQGWPISDLNAYAAIFDGTLHGSKARKEAYSEMYNSIKQVDYINSDQPEQVRNDLFFEMHRKMDEVDKLPLEKGDGLADRKSIWEMARANILSNAEKENVTMLHDKRIRKKNVQQEEPPQKEEEVVQPNQEKQEVPQKDEEVVQPKNGQEQEQHGELQQEEEIPENQVIGDDWVVYSRKDLEELLDGGDPEDEPGDEILDELLEEKDPKEEITDIEQLEKELNEEQEKNAENELQVDPDYQAANDFFAGLNEKDDEIIQEVEKLQEQVDQEQQDAPENKEAEDHGPEIAVPKQAIDYSEQDRKILEEYQDRLSQNAMSVHGVNQYRENWAKEAMRRITEINDPENLRQRQLLIQVSALGNGWNITDMEVLDRFVACVEAAPEELRENGRQVLADILAIQLQDEGQRSTVFEMMSDFVAERALAAGEDEKDAFIAFGGRLQEQKNKRQHWSEFPLDRGLLDEAQRSGQFDHSDFWDNMKKDDLKTESVVRNRLRYLAEQNRRRDAKDQKNLREKEKYVLPEMKPEDLDKWKRNSSYRYAEAHISGRSAAQFVFGQDLYDAIDKKYRGTEEERTVNIHHSLGTKYNNAGSHVLQIDIGGSGYAAPTHEHHGVSAWDGSGGLVGEKEGMENDALFTAEYGERTKVRGHEEKTEIRKKSSETKLKDGSIVKKERFSIPGPTGFASLGGTRNAGDYSIENTRQVVRQIGEDFLTPIFREWDEHPDRIKDIHINISGHSRGACGAGEGMELLRKWLIENEQYNKYADKVVFDGIQMDPVPGYGNRSEHAKVDYRSEVPEGKKQPRINGTVIYSMSTEYDDAMFRPQIVEHADRVIFGMTSHAVGLNIVDRSQLRVDGDGQAHRRGFYDPETGEFYRGSGISELPEGVYFSDDKQNLIRISSISQLNDVMDIVCSGAYRQNERQNVLRATVKNWFAEHTISSSYRNPEEREQIQLQAKQAEEKLLKGNDQGYGLGSIREKIEALRNVRKTDNAPDIEKAEDALLKDCREYLKKVPVSAKNLAVKDRKNMDLVGDLMSGLQRERNFNKQNKQYTQRNEPLPEDVKKQRTMEDAKRADHMISALENQVEEFRKIFEDQEKRYSPQQKNTRVYLRMRDALKECTQLGKNSSVREIMGTMSELNMAAKDYLEKRSSLNYKTSVFGLPNKIRYWFSPSTRQRVGFANNLISAAELMTNTFVNGFEKIYDKNSSLEKLVSAYSLKTENAPEKQKEEVVTEPKKERGEPIVHEEKKATQTIEIQKTVEISFEGKKEEAKPEKIPEKDASVNPQKKEKEETGKKESVKKEEPKAKYEKGKPMAVHVEGWGQNSYFYESKPSGKEGRRKTSFDLLVENGKKESNNKTDYAAKRAELKKSLEKNDEGNTIKRSNTVIK